jgi:reverse gyrase
MEGAPINYRRETQRSVGFYADVRFINLLNAHLRRTRVSKSQFIRDAVAEKLRIEGVVVPEEIIVPLPPYSEDAVEKRKG